MMRRAMGTSTAIVVSATALLSLFAAACASTTHAPASTTETTAAPSSAAATIATSTAGPSAVATNTEPPSNTPPPVRTPSPPSDSATIIYHGDTSRRMVALTFDAGADTGYTGEILDTLRREGIRATFGVTGVWAERNHELVLAIAADGHRFINHTYDHDSFTGLSTGKPPLTGEERALELSRAETTIYHITQRSTRPYFRPPYGDLDSSVQRDVAANGYATIVMWSVDSLGWKRATADAIVARCLENATPGAIYVMHVGSESQDAAALPRVIAGLRAAGYTFGTIDDMLAAG